MNPQQPGNDDIALKDHILAVIASNDRRYDDRFAAVKEAVNKAETAMEKRFEGVNEFRNTLADQQRTFIPRPEFESVVEGMKKDIANLSQSFREQRGSDKGLLSGWSMAVGIVGFVAIVVGLFLAFKR